MCMYIYIEYTCISCTCLCLGAGMVQKDMLITSSLIYLGWIRDSMVLWLWLGPRASPKFKDISFHPMKSHWVFDKEATLELASNNTHHAIILPPHSCFTDNLCQFGIYSTIPPKQLLILLHLNACKAQTTGILRVPAGLHDRFTPWALSSVGKQKNFQLFKKSSEKKTSMAQSMPSFCFSHLHNLIIRPSAPHRQRHHESQLIQEGLPTSP